MIIYLPTDKTKRSNRERNMVARIEKRTSKGHHWVMAVEFTPDGKRWVLWIFYRVGVKGDYRWKVISANGRIIAASTEGYRQFARAADNARISGYSGPRTLRL